MNFDLIKGYVLTGLSAAVLVAGGVLVLMNSENHGQFHLFVRSIPNFNIAGLMLWSAVGGLLLAGSAWMLVRGIKRIRAGYRKKRQQGTPPGQPQA
jgi:hypothetical protein